MLRLFFFTLVLGVGAMTLLAKFSALVESGALGLWIAIAIGLSVAAAIAGAAIFFFVQADDIRYDLKKARRAGDIPLHLLIGGWFVGGGADVAAGCAGVSHAPDVADAGGGDAGGGE